MVGERGTKKSHERQSTKNTETKKEKRERESVGTERGDGKKKKEDLRKKNRGEAKKNREIRRGTDEKDGERKTEPGLQQTQPAAHHAFITIFFVLSRGKPRETRVADFRSPVSSQRNRGRPLAL